MHVLLLKEPRDGGSGPDPYIKVKVFALLPAVIPINKYCPSCFHFSRLGLIPQELASHGHQGTLIPVLSFKFVSLNMLTDKVNLKKGALSALKLFCL